MSKSKRLKNPTDKKIKKLAKKIRREKGIKLSDAQKIVSKEQGARDLREAKRMFRAKALVRPAASSPFPYLFMKTEESVLFRLLPMDMPGYEPSIIHFHRNLSLSSLTALTGVGPRALCLRENCPACTEAEKRRKAEQEAEKFEADYFKRDIKAVAAAHVLVWEVKKLSDGSYEYAEGGPAIVSYHVPARGLEGGYDDLRNLIKEAAEAGVRIDDPEEGLVVEMQRARVYDLSRSIGRRVERHGVHRTSHGFGEWRAKKLPLPANWGEKLIGRGGLGAGILPMTGDEIKKILKLDAEFEIPVPLPVGTSFPYLRPIKDATASVSTLVARREYDYVRDKALDLDFSRRSEAALREIEISLKSELAAIDKARDKLETLAVVGGAFAGTLRRVLDEKSWQKHEKQAIEDYLKAVQIYRNFRRESDKRPS